MRHHAMRIRLVDAAAICLIVVAASVHVGAQAPPPAGPARDNAAVPRTGTGRIRGRVTTADSGAPVRRASVRLTNPGSPADRLETPPLVATDDQGYYEFRALPPGRYTLAASKSGFMTLSYGQRRPLESARPLELADGQFLDRVDLSLPRGATIVARITDEFGDPISGLNVVASQYRFSGGERRLVSVSETFGFGIGTNDLGEQRLSGLPPGDYYVGVFGRGLGGGQGIGPADKGRAYAATYYPGTASLAEAQRVTVAVGQEIRLSFPVVPVRTVRISGTVRSSTGAAPVRPSISLQDTSPTVTGGSRSVTAQPDGSFVAQTVFPGNYTLTVSPNLATVSTIDPNASAEYARVPITVADRDITGLTITTSRGVTVRGRFVFDTGAPPATLQPAALQFSIVFPRPGSGVGAAGRPVLNPDWTFEIGGVGGSGGQVRLNNAVNSSGWFLKSVMLVGKDITDVPLDFESGKDITDLQVMLTQKRTDVSGVVVDSRSEPLTDYVAVFFPVDRNLWTSQSRFIAVARPDQKGQFKILGLPPGKYLVAAVDYLETGSERDPDLLGRLVDKATPVTLGEGETKSVSLTLVP